MVKQIKKRWILILTVLAVGTGLFYAARGVPPQGASQKNDKYVVKRQDLKQTLTLSGKVDAEEKVVLRFQTSGRLSWVGVKEGDAVKKYQAIASLDQRDVKKTLEKKLNSYMKTRWDFEQTQDDYEGKIVTDAIKRILEKAQFDLNSAVLDVELQQLSVEFSTLVSPIDGVVTHIDTPFAAVNIVAAQAEFEVVNPQSVYLSVLADQTEVTKLKQGMEVAVTFDAYPGQILVGTIAKIAFIPKTGETGTVYGVTVKLPIDNQNYTYRMEMSADAVFTTKEKNNVLAVPSAFIKQDKEKKYVWAKRGNKKEKVAIAVGEEFDNETEILSGLSEGDIVYAQ